MTMKKIAYFLMTLVAAVTVFSSCSDDETYADQKKRERNAISERGIKVLKESEFEANGCVTDTAKNEFVYLDDSNVYMQIIRKGCGKKIEKGETATVLCRYEEYNLLTDSLQSTNMIGYYISVVDKMNVQNTSGTFTASFEAGESRAVYLHQRGQTGEGRRRDCQGKTHRASHAGTPIRYERCLSMPVQHHLRKGKINLYKTIRRAKACLFFHHRRL